MNLMARENSTFVSKHKVTRKYAVYKKKPMDSVIEKQNISTFNRNGTEICLNHET